jgi:hypothetical protein
MAYVRNRRYYMEGGTVENFSVDGKAKTITLRLRFNCNETEFQANLEKNHNQGKTFQLDELRYYTDDFMKLVIVYDVVQCDLSNVVGCSDMMSPSIDNLQVRLAFAEFMWHFQV